MTYFTEGSLPRESQLKKFITRQPTYMRGCFLIDALRKNLKFIRITSIQSDTLGRQDKHRCGNRTPAQFCLTCLASHWLRIALPRPRCTSGAMALSFILARERLVQCQFRHLHLWQFPDHFSHRSVPHLQLARNGA